MSILRAKYGEKTPEGYIMCTEEEALEYQVKLIHQWTPWTDVWALKAGVPLLTASGGLSAVVIADRYMKKFNLNSVARLGLLFPAVVTPVIALSVLQYKLVTENVLLQKECPLCIMARAAGLQVGLGFVYPLVLSPITASVLSYIFLSYRGPDLTWRNVPAYYDICKKFIRPKRNTLIGLGIFNVLLSFFIVDSQARNVFGIAHRVEELEKIKH